MKSAPQQRFARPITLCRRENSQLPRFQAIPHSCLPRAHFAKGRKNTETATLTTFRINTCKSVLKQRTLTPFRMNTYKKTGGGGCRQSAGSDQQLPCSRLSQRPSYAPRSSSIPSVLTRLRILPVATGVRVPLYPER